MRSWYSRGAKPGSSKDSGFALTPRCNARCSLHRVLGPVPSCRAHSAFLQTVRSYCNLFSSYLRLRVIQYKPFAIRVMCVECLYTSPTGTKHSRAFSVLVFDKILEFLYPRLLPLPPTSCPTFSPPATHRQSLPPRWVLSARKVMRSSLTSLLTPIK